MNLIKELKKKFPELKKNKRGVPFVGRKINGLKYSKNAKQIVNSYSLYTDTLFNLKNSNCGIDNCTLDSGDPLKYPLFPPIKKELKKLLKTNSFYKYPRASGEIECRKKIIEFLMNEDFNNVPLNEKKIIFTMSTTHAFNLIIKLIARPNDVIIFTAPNYGLFAIICERLGMTLKYIELSEEDNYLVNTEKLDSLIKKTNKELAKKYKNEKYIPRVVAFFNENPNNPTGKVMGAKNIDLLNKIGKVCQNNNLFIIDDLVYKDTTYDRNNIALPIGNNNLFFNNTISLYGLSKSFGGAGLRSGFIIANETIILGIKNSIFQDMDSTPLEISYSCYAAYNLSKMRTKAYNKYFNKLIKKYKKQYELLKYIINGSNINIKSFDKIIKKFYTTPFKQWNGINGVKLIKNLEPESGFFAIIDFYDIIKKMKLPTSTTEESLLKYLYANTGIKYIMGKSMAWPNKKQYVGRINYGESPEMIVKTFIELKKFLENERKENLNE